MPTAVVVDAIRTPLGKRNGQLAGWHPVDLARPRAVDARRCATTSIPRWSTT